MFRKNKEEEYAFACQNHNNLWSLFKGEITPYYNEEANIFFVTELKTEDLIIKLWELSILDIQGL